MLVSRNAWAITPFICEKRLGRSAFNTYKLFHFAEYYRVPLMYEYIIIMLEQVTGATSRHYLQLKSCHNYSHSRKHREDVRIVMKKSQQVDIESKNSDKILARKTVLCECEVFFVPPSSI